jgi:hypothetical protein
MKKLDALLRARAEYGPGCAARVEKLLASFAGLKFKDAATLIQFHDTLLFLRAFPHSRKVLLLADKLLSSIAGQVRDVLDCADDCDLFDSEQFSGIAGTSVRDTHTYEAARWLFARYSRELEVEWDWDEQARQLSSSMPPIVPLLGDDCLVEADTPYADWLSAAAGGKDEILGWLMRCLERDPRPMLEKTAWYDALNINIVWQLGDSPASRTHARRNPASFYYHTGPLLQRKQVSLADELNSAPLSVRQLSHSEGEQLLDFARAVLAVRYRELWGTTRGDPAQVIEADLGRGVQMFLWGMPPEPRLPLRAYFAGTTVKNGVPINYLEVIGLAEWMEIGFNTFYAFREGETAWIYSKVLHLLNQLLGATVFSVYPYQLGKDNDEAIKSGAFWFYRKLSFRPGNPELLKLTEREEAKIAKTPRYRSSYRTLSRLASEHVFYEMDDASRGAWDTFSVRNIGLAVQRRMAKLYDGDPVRMRQAELASLARILNLDPTKWPPSELAAFADFAVVLGMVPDLQRWSNAEKLALVDVIRAKAGDSETGYVRRLQQHPTLKRALQKLGSSATSDRHRVAGSTG